MQRQPLESLQETMRYILSRTKEEGVGQKGRRSMNGVGGEGSRSHLPRTLGTNIFQSQQLTCTHIGTLVWSAVGSESGEPWRSIINNQSRFRDGIHLLPSHPLKQREENFFFGPLLGTREESSQVTLGFGVTYLGLAEGPSYISSDSF